MGSMLRLEETPVRPGVRGNGNRRSAYAVAARRRRAQATRTRAPPPRRTRLDGTGTVTQPAYPSFAQMGRVLAISSRSVGWWPLLGACGVWLAALAWVRPLASPDETRYTDIPRWMVRSGDWLVPRIDGLPFVHKPPLYFWIEAAFIKAFGISALVSRLPSLGAAIVICACVHKLVNDCNGSRAALWSLAVLLFNPLFFVSDVKSNCTSVRMII